MAARYRFIERGDEETLSPPMRYWTAVNRFRKRIKRRRPDRGRVKIRGKTEWSRYRSIADLMVRVPRKMVGLRVGDMLKVDLEQSSWTLDIRRVDIAPKIPNTPGTDPIDVIYYEVMKKFSGVQNWGMCNCRRIDGTSTWSQHAWCNAWDLHASIATTDAIYHYLETNKGRLKISHILWRGVPGHYPGHLHVDCEPYRLGVPPCA